MELRDDVVVLRRPAPGDIDAVEAHGTGTPLGDPIEVSALTKAYRAAGVTRTGYCGLGSVKSNFGHLDSAAGVTGLIKTALALHHRRIPPTLHFEQPNPKCNFATSPFYVTGALAEWPRTNHRRRAAVSSFGIGGTNAHVVLEEAPDTPPVPRTDPPTNIVLLSAKTPAALDESARRLADHLDAHPQTRLSDVACTLQLGRQPLTYRRAVVAADAADAARALRGADAKRLITGAAGFGTRSVALMFPGGGTQYVPAPDSTEAINAQLPSGSRPKYNIDQGDTEWAPSVGIGVNFGGGSKPAAAPVPAPAEVCSDSDNDGVCDNVDKCPDTPANVTVDADGCPAVAEVVRVELDVKFDFDKSVVKPNSYGDIKNLADFMKQYPSTTTTVEGHTDSVGPDAYNQKLSERRANAVKQVLTNQYGVESSRVQSVGYGESRPVADNKTEAGRAVNRRVEAQVEAPAK